ncbi:hypothetical protein [[Mycoplasma] anseris]|uniref:Uncharacterized protein n=1 Tax=[Mycoplasma] anseris TaxID=92400 RepID=A0A2Z4NCR1_9BACT|nr:hypothetical protein [[Mycoplasma] anseris]AWX69342.1 hypothetical protein DP065_01050 [[Mycoplasma] anseris]
MKKSRKIALIVLGLAAVAAISTTAYIFARKSNKNVKENKILSLIENIKEYQKQNSNVIDNISLNTEFASLIDSLDKQSNVEDEKELKDILDNSNAKFNVLKNKMEYLKIENNLVSYLNEINNNKYQNIYNELLSKKNEQNELVKKSNENEKIEQAKTALNSALEKAKKDVQVINETNNKKSELTKLNEDIAKEITTWEDPKYEPLKTELTSFLDTQNTASKKENITLDELKTIIESIKNKFNEVQGKKLEMDKEAIKDELNTLVTNATSILESPYLINGTDNTNKDHFNEVIEFSKELIKKPDTTSEKYSQQISALKNAINTAEEQINTQRNELLSKLRERVELPSDYLNDEEFKKNTKNLDTTLNSEIEKANAILSVDPKTVLKPNLVAAIEKVTETQEGVQNYISALNDLKSLKEYRDKIKDKYTLKIEDLNHDINSYETSLGRNYPSLKAYASLKSFIARGKNKAVINDFNAYKSAINEFKNSEENQSYFTDEENNLNKIFKEFDNINEITSEMSDENINLITNMNKKLEEAQKTKKSLVWKKYVELKEKAKKYLIQEDYSEINSIHHAYKLKQLIDDYESYNESIETSAVHRVNTQISDLISKIDSSLESDIQTIYSNIETYINTDNNNKEKRDQLQGKLNTIKPEIDSNKSSGDINIVLTKLKELNEFFNSNK